MRKVYLSFALALTFSLAFATTKNSTNNPLQAPHANAEVGDPAFAHLYATGSPYSGLLPQNEEIAKRSLESKHFAVSATRHTALIGAGPVHYRENGEWKTISYHIAPNQTGTYTTYPYLNKWNEFKTLYGTPTVGNKIILADKSEINLWRSPKIVFADQNLQPIRSLSANAATALVSHDKLQYNNLFGANVAAAFEQKTSGCELSYIIPDASLFNNLPTSVRYFGFSEVMEIPQGWAITKKIDEHTGKQYLSIADPTGVVKMKYKDAIIKEQSSSPIRKPYDEKDPLSAKTLFAAFDITPISATRVVVTYYADINWFTFTNRNFPIVFDPTADCYPNISQYWTGTSQKHITSCGAVGGCFGGNSAGIDGFDDGFRIGYYDGSGCCSYDNYYYQPFAKINLASIPTNACINSGTFFVFQNNIATPQALACVGSCKFRFGTFGGDPTVDSWTTIYNNINGLSNEYNRWDVFGLSCSCGTSACGDYQENGGNGYRSFNAGAASIQAALGSGSINYAFDNCEDYDQHCGTFALDDSYYIDFDGYNGNSKPYAHIDYETPPTAPTAISSSAGTSLCPGSSTTLTLSGGSLGSIGTWRWYAGGCGTGGSIGTGTSIGVTPLVTTTYYVRAESACGGPTACASLKIVVDTLSTAPTSITGSATICNGDSTSLSVLGGSLGTGAQWRWFSGSCNSTPIGTGTSIKVAPSTTTSYYVQAVGTCNSTACAGITVTVNINSIAPSGISGVATICKGSSTYLTAQAGLLGTGANWIWYRDSCGGIPIASGASITVSPTDTTAYYVRAEGVCNTTACATQSIAVNPQPNGGIIAFPSTICPGKQSRLVSYFTSGIQPYTIIYSDGVNTNFLAGVYNGDSIIVSPTTTSLYSFTQITDSVGCTRTLGFIGGAAVVVAPAPGIYSIAANNVRCNGDSTASIIVNAGGGTLPFLYSIDGGTTFSNSNSFTNLGTGSYVVQIKDAQGCIANGAAPVPISQPLGLSVTDSLIHPLCYGYITGQVLLQVAGGTQPYTYQWSDGSFDQNLTGVSAGTYTVHIADSLGCIYWTSYTLTVAPALNLRFDSVANLTCYGISAGYISSQVSGGTPGYHYSWSNSTTAPVIATVASGTYTLTVTDTVGCTITLSHTLTSPLPLLSSIAGNSPDCHGNASGFAVVSPAGGTAPYSYLWNTTPAQTGVIAIKLAGNSQYRITITDANGCTKIDSVQLTEPSAVSVAFQPTGVTCFSGNDGTVIVHASGGNTPYSYYLNGVYQIDSIFNGLVAGNYVVVAQDVNGCHGAATFSITQPAAFTLSAGNDVTAFRQEPVHLHATAYSSNGIRSFDWNTAPELSCTACADPIATCDSTQSFVVRATDSTGCIQFDTVVVVVKKDFLYYIPTAFTPNGDDWNNFFEVYILGAKTIATKIFDRWGELVYSNDNMLNGRAAAATDGEGRWDGKFKGKDVPYETYTYQINVQLYGEDITRTISGTVTTMR